MLGHVWSPLANDLIHRTQTEGEVTLTIEEIAAVTGTSDQLAIAGDRRFWLAAQRGDKYTDGFTKHRLELTLSPNEPGKRVERVTFRMRQS